MNLKRLQILTVFVFLFLGALTSSASEMTLLRDLSESVSESVRGDLRMSYHSGTTKLRFLGPPPSIALPQPLAIHPDATPEVAAKGFLNVYGSLFGISDPERELQAKKSRQLKDGRSVIKFKQVHQDIPIIGGEVVVNIDRAKN